jgi:hypothetical protein
VTDRTDAYMLRIEKQIAELNDNDAAISFLNTLIAGWECLYEEFMARGGDNAVAGDDPPTAFDYVMTITSLVAKHDLIKEIAVEQAWRDDEWKADQWAMSNGLDVILPDGTKIFGD